MCVYSGLHKGLDIHHGNAVMKIILSFVGRAFVYTPLLFVKFVVLFLLLATTKSVSMYFSLKSDFFALLHEDSHHGCLDPFSSAILL